MWWSTDNFAEGAADKRFSLISVEQFRKLQDSGSSWIAIDVRPRMHYSLGHISGAFNLWRPDYEASAEEYPFSGMRADPKKMEHLLSQLGVTPDTLLVLYDEHSNIDSCRLWWILRLYGHLKVVLLDGGLSAWREAGYDVVMRYSVPTAKQKSAYRFNSDQAKTGWLAELSDVHDALNDKRSVLLDVRAFSEVTGKQKKSGAFRKGRIPGSRWLEYNRATGENGFLPKQQLESLFKNAGITPEDRVIVYCQSGVRSANTLFVLKELLNYPYVKNYDGSWIEWSYHKELPAATGPVE